MFSLSFVSGVRVCCLRFHLLDDEGNRLLAPCVITLASPVPGSPSNSIQRPQSSCITFCVISQGVVAVPRSVLRAVLLRVGRWWAGDMGGAHHWKVAGCGSCVTREGPAVPGLTQRIIHTYTRRRPSWWWGLQPGDSRPGDWRSNRERVRGALALRALDTYRMSRSHDH